MKGFAHLFGVFIISLIILAAISAGVPITRHYADGQSRVAGVSTIPNASKVKLLALGNQTAFITGVAGAVSQYPVKLDPESGTVLVTTPVGEKSLAVLPDSAVKSALYAKILDDVKSVNPEGALASVNQLLGLQDKNGVLCYIVRGDKKNKILGILPIKTGVTGFISSENGQVVETQTSLLGRILNRLNS